MKKFDIKNTGIMRPAEIFSLLNCQTPEQRQSRNWTEYQLAQESGLPQSTISSWYRKQMLPTLQSLEKICVAFDMTMAQFLAEGDSLTEITPDQRELLSRWELLSPRQKQAFLELMKSVIVQ